MAKNWTVQFMDPKDFFYSSTLTVDEWIKKEMPISGRTEHELRLEWAEASNILGADPRFGLGGVRGEPRVAYDIHSDSYYFIFKMDDNGNVFVVSDGRIIDAADEVRP
jgi:hypothetical protein